MPQTGPSSHSRPSSGPGGRRPGPGGARPAGGPGGAGRPRRPGGMMAKRKVCRFCADRVNHVDWKALHILRSFVTDRGKILSSRTTGTCAKHQRQLTIGIKRARTMALLPFLVTG